MRSELQNAAVGRLELKRFLPLVEMTEWRRVAAIAAIPNECEGSVVMPLRNFTTEGTEITEG